MPAAQHAKEVGAEAGIEDSFHFIHCQDYRFADLFKQVALHVTGAALAVADCCLPVLINPILQFQFIRQPGTELIKKCIFIGKSGFIKQLKI